MTTVDADIAGLICRVGALEIDILVLKKEHTAVVKVNF